MKMNNRRGIWLVLALTALVALALAACGGAAAPATVGKATPAEIADRIPADLNNGLILLDVRTPQEWTDDGHIAGATLLPIDELPNRALNELPTDAEIVVYCRSGNRSAQAADWLIQNGFTDVSDLGGINDWKAQGYPVEFGP
jgi:rhodanese-related sulfurtransferase